VEARTLQSFAAHGSYGKEELQRFWRLASTAGYVLATSNPQLGLRAGLGEDFFSSVVREQRRPKLANFLRALSVIVEVADERLSDIEQPDHWEDEFVPPVLTVIGSRLEDRANILSLASSLAQMARSEIEKLDDERPNDPATLAKNAHYRELLMLFAAGFERIAVALNALAENPNEPMLVGEANKITKVVGDEIAKWLKKNGTEAVDWSMRLPCFAAGVALLGWAGANMTVATSAVATIVGVTKVASVVRSKKTGT
jgi:hypothetical protein